VHRLDRWLDEGPYTLRLLMLLLLLVLVGGGLWRRLTRVP